jgi:hypothetical protein
MALEIPPSKSKCKRHIKNRHVGSSLIVVGICSTKVVFVYVTVNHTIPRNKYLF